MGEKSNPPIPPAKAPRSLVEAERRRERYLAEAYAMLEIDPSELDSVPKIEHLFKAAGGTKKIWECLEGSEEPEAKALLEFRRRLNWNQRAAVPFEAICVAAKITTKRAFGVISQEVMEQSVKATALLARARHPEVVEATIERSLGPLGTHDAKMLHQAMGFVPVPKNSVTIIHGNVDARRQTANIALLPPLESTARRISDRFNSQMRLPEPPAALQIEAEEDEDEE